MSTILPICIAPWGKVCLWRMLRALRESLREEEAGLDIGTGEGMPRRDWLIRRMGFVTGRKVVSSRPSYVAAPYIR